MANKPEKYIKKFADQYAADLLLEDEISRAFRDKPFTNEERNDELLTLDTVQSEVREALAFSDHSWSESIVDKLIEGKRLKQVKKGTPVYQLLCREILKAIDRTVTVQLKRWDGDYSRDETSAPLKYVTSGLLEELKALITSRVGRTSADWAVIRNELLRRASASSLPRDDTKSIIRIEVCRELRDWYFTNYMGTGFKKQNESAAETIRERLKRDFDELDKDSPQPR
jgi:hypothetical protein